MRSRRTSSLRRWVALGCLAGLTCGDLDVITVREEATAMIPRAGLIQMLVEDLGFEDLVAIDIEQSEELRNQGVERHQIDSVRIAGIQLEVADPPEGQDLGFLLELSFFVESEGLPRRRIAHGGPFEPGARAVELEIDDVELVEYATAEAMDITTEARGRAPEADTTLRAVVELRVDVDLRGAACGP